MDGDWTGFGLSDVGLVRGRNEDCFALAPEIGCFVVADGMGGHPGGDIASATAVAAALDALRDAPDALAQAVLAANGAVVAAAARDPALTTMGTTLSILRLAGDRAGIGHVGDSRIYALSPAGLAQLTDDHTQAAESVRRGRLAAAEARRSGGWHVLIRVVGTAPPPRPLVAEVDLAGITCFLLCTDGVSDMLDDRAIAALLAAHPGNARGAAEAVVAAAIDAGGHDNATAVVVSRL